MISIGGPTEPSYDRCKVRHSATQVFVIVPQRTKGLAPQPRLLYTKKVRSFHIVDVPTHQSKSGFQREVMVLRPLRQLIVIAGACALVALTLVLLRSDERSQDLLPPSPHVQNSNFDLVKYGRPVHEIFSVSTSNRKYFTIATGEYESYNPSILVHPTKPDTWILIAQQERTDVPNTVWFAQLTCEAKFRKGKLVCTRPPMTVPIGVTAVGHDNCKGELAYLAFNVGPHDARALYGPENPYIVYGSQSQYNCFGIWIQDLRIATDWGVVPASSRDPKHPFRAPTELQRPPPLGEVEKNWFPFWDDQGTMYIHYDTWPKRAFAEVTRDGSAGPDLAPQTAEKDKKCLDRYVPKLPDDLESIHQATNSLSITMCKRSDQSCTPTNDNTYIMSIFHHKNFYNWHGEYEPYVMLFKQTAPFELHGISEAPLWIHGRGALPRREGIGANHPWNNTQMFYVTSISWRDHKYHGYLDDVMFLGFGIEDRVAAAIDVLAADTVANIGLCSSVVGETPVQAETKESGDEQKAAPTEVVAAAGEGEEKLEFSSAEGT